MAITTQDFTALVRNQVAAIQGAAKTLQDLTVGSILRSVVEANAAVILWLQGLILQLLATTRLSTSTGADVDSFVADFGYTRVAAAAASGQVTFARFTSTQQAVVPVGAIVQTADGTQQFSVIVDTANAAYSAALNGFVIAAGASSINVTVQSITNGPSGFPDASGNVVAGAISALTAAVPGVDTVTNAIAFQNGQNPAADAAAKAGFVQYIGSLSKATKAAIELAAKSLAANIVVASVENFDYTGVSKPGYFYVVIDDGTGVPSSTLLSSVSNAIDAVRGFTINFGVFAPVVVNATVVLTATIAAGYDPVSTKLVVKNALSNYINSLVLGQSIPYTRLSQIAYDASPGVTNITAVTLNGGTADLAATNQQVIKSTAVTVN